MKSPHLPRPTLQQDIHLIFCLLSKMAASVGDSVVHGGCGGDTLEYSYRSDELYLFRSQENSQATI